MVKGCIPVIIQDGVHQPFETVLPYWRFSVRLAKADLPRLPQLLSAIDHDEVRRAVQR
jgi:Exostosin family